MNILLFGKTGQVGWELQRALAPLGNLIALDVHSTDYCGDFSNPEGVAETVRSIRPDMTTYFRGPVKYHGRRRMQPHR